MLLKCVFCFWQSVGVELYVFAGMVLLYSDDSRKYLESEWFTYKRMVATPSLHLDCCVWSVAYLAQHEDVV